MSKNQPGKPGCNELGHRARAAAQTAMTDHFVEAQYVWTSFLLEHLVAVRRRFGDLDTALLLTVIGLSALKAARAGDPPNTPVNAHSLAVITGIARETVRRKLVALGHHGWIEPAPDGGWRLALNAGGDAQARRDLDDITQETNRRIARLVGELVRIGMPQG